MNVYFLEPALKIEQIYYQCLQTISSHGRRSISRRKPGFQKPTIHMEKLIIPYISCLYFLAIIEERYLVALTRLVSRERAKELIIYLYM